MWSGEPVISTTAAGVSGSLVTVLRIVIVSAAPVVPVTPRGPVGPGMPCGP